MREFIKRYEIWIFLVLAPIANLVMTYANNLEIIKGFVYTHGRFYVLLSLLVGIILFTRGISGVKDLFRPILNWKINPKWYVFSLLFSLTICCFTLLIRAYYDGKSDLYSVFKVDFPPLRNCIILLSWAFLGEVVWVSYAVRTLSKKMKPFFASQVIGVFWTLWWLPSVYINVGVINDLPAWSLLLNMMGAAGMCAIVYGQTKSGTCVWLLQYMMNMSVLILPVAPLIGGVPTYSTYAVLYFLTMLVFMYFMNPIKNETKKMSLKKIN